MLRFFQENIYSVVAGTALLVHLIIDWNQLFARREARSRAGAMEFRQFLVCLTVFFVADVAWGFVEALRWPGLLYADTLAFFLTMAL